MKMFILVLLQSLQWFLCASALAGDAPSAFPPQRDPAFAVIAYVHGPASGITAHQLERVTHLNYSFLRLDGNRLGFRTRDSIAIAQLVSLKSGHPGLKVILSVGGWGGCENCSEVFASEDGRRGFARSAREVLDRTRADGIDLDWEYPAIAGYPGHPFGPEDRHNFTLLLAELRRAFADSMELSFAAGGYREFLEKSVEWDQVVPLIDKVNLMSYDLVNGNSTRTGHHTPLYSTPEQRESADHAIHYLDSVGVPGRKIIIGAAFYARVWEGVEDAGNGLYQQGKFKTFVGYRGFDEFFGGSFAPLVRWDSVAQAPFWYDPGQKLFATFDDSLSVSRKTRYAIAHRLGGIMFWELTGDSPENGLLDAITRARQNSD